MKISENAQELLEQLWIANQENGDNPSLDESTQTSFDEIQHLGFVTLSSNGYQLTRTGLTEAGFAIRRHRLAERLMADVLMMEEALVDEQACNMEHALFDGVDDSICTLLGHPKFCPHGKPIPPGECCRNHTSSIGPLIEPLLKLKNGQKGRIAYIQMNNPQRLQKLMSMGVLPGVPVRVLANFPSYVFEAGHSQFAVDEEIAADIFIRRTG